MKVKKETIFRSIGYVWLWFLVLMFATPFLASAMKGEAIDLKSLISTVGPVEMLIIGALFLPAAFFLWLGYRGKLQSKITPEPKNGAPR